MNESFSQMAQINGRSLLPKGRPSYRPIDLCTRASKDYGLRSYNLPVNLTQSWPLLLQSLSYGPEAKYGFAVMPQLHQYSTAQSTHGTKGHATRAGHTATQPDHFEYDFSATGGFPQPPVFEDKAKERLYLKGRLAAAFRIFGQRGFDEGVAGHITVRDPIEPHTMWVNPFGIAFSHMRQSDLIRIDYDGKVLEGGHNQLVNRAAVLIHAAVHRARPDVVSAAHTHSPNGRAYSVLGRPLPITTQDGCAFYNDLALYNRFEGIVLEGSEGEHIAQAIGNKKAAILQNHGLLTCAATVEATVFWYISLEKLCLTQLQALAAVGGDESKITVVGQEEAARSYVSLGQPMSGWFSAKPIFDMIAEETHEAYLA